MFDGKAYGEGIVELVKGYVEREVAPLKAENESLKVRIAELEARPAPEVLKGDPGESIEPETVNAMVVAEVARVAAGIRVPQDGKDAANIVEVLKDDGELVLTLQDGRLLRTGIRDGENGKDGHNGFNLDDFNVERGDDGRTFILKFQREDIRHEYELTFPVPVYCGIYKAGEDYVPGDLVTWGGNLWHCDAETKDKPDAGPWTLAVKKGRDGKDAK